MTDSEIKFKLITLLVSIILLAYILAYCIGQSNQRINKLEKQLAHIQRGSK